MASNICCADHAVSKGNNHLRNALAPMFKIRAAHVSAWIPRVKRSARQVLDTTLRDVVARVRRGFISTPSVRMLHQPKMRMFQALRPATYGVVAQGIALTQKELALFFAMRSKKGLKDMLEIARSMNHPSVERWLDVVGGSATQSQAAFMGVRLGAMREEGLSEDEMADQLLKEGLAYDETAAARIAHTDTNWAMNEGTVQEYKAQNITQMEWVTSHEDNVCPWCQDMDGEIVDVSDNFLDAGDDLEVGERTWTALYNVSHPPLHPNCLVGETPVLAVDKRSAFAAAYDGPVVEVTLSDGRRLTVTPNHMLLTPQGFAQASRLRKGDHILDYLPFKGIVGSDPHNDNSPALVKNVVRALAEAPSMVTYRVPVSPEYLHGDACFGQSHIDVVAPDGLLTNDIMAELVESGDKPHLGASHPELETFPGSRTLALLLETMVASTDGCMGRSRLPTAFLGRESLVEQDARFRSTPNLQTQSDKARDNRHPADPEFLRHTQDRFPGQITTTQIASIDVHAFSGHVYDLQSKSSLYIANGILSSNCACTLIPYLGTVEGEENG